MKKLFLLLMVAIVSATAAYSKPYADNPDSSRTSVSEEVKGSWMCGHFSMTEYWSQNPVEYIGNGVEYAFAFTFNADGTYTQYFTAGTVTNGVRTYQQSVAKGTVEIDPVSKAIKTHALQVHYRRTAGKQIVEDRDLAKGEFGPNNSYTYTRGQEPNGTDALYLTLEGTSSPLTFLHVH
jgi:hypothetical protein